MQRTMVLLTGIISLLLLPGCASRAVIADLENDKAIIQLTGSDLSVADAEAQKGCNIHGKYAQRISYICKGSYCSRKDVLYACIEGSALRGPALQEITSQESPPHTRTSGPPKTTPLSWSDRAMREGLR